MVFLWSAFVRKSVEMIADINKEFGIEAEESCLTHRQAVASRLNSVQRREPLVQTRKERVMVEAHDHTDDEVCGCGTVQSALETAMTAVEDAFYQAQQGKADGMCFAFQVTVAHAITAICMRALQKQLHAAGGNLPVQAERAIVGKLVETLETKISEHMLSRVNELEQYVTEMLAMAKANPFEVKREGDGGISADEPEKHSVH